MMSKAKAKGYTMMELVVVLAIVGILAAIALPSFSLQIKEGRLQSYAYDVHSLYKFARGKAASENKEITFQLSDEVWQVIVDGDTDPTRTYTTNYSFIDATGSFSVEITNIGAVGESGSYTISDNDDDTDDYKLCIYISGQSTLYKLSEAPECS